jgi:thiol peroxidase
MKGKPVSLKGTFPKKGSEAPDFCLVDGELKDKTLADYKGKKKIISIVPSLDTPTCSISTKKFNDAALKDKTWVFIVVSCDLPFAQKRFCIEEEAKHVLTLSMMRSKKFAEDYGVLIQDGPIAGLCTRAVVVLDENNKVLHSELVAEISSEPDYKAALDALKT